MLPWKSIIRINKEAKRSVYLQISDTIINEINIGHLKPGQKLPSSRWLAENLTVNRKTINAAIDEIQAQGWIDVIPNKGTYVKSSLPTFKPKKLSEINFRTQAISQPILKHYIAASIDDGIPDYRLAPIDKLYRQAGNLVTSSGSKSILRAYQAAGEPLLRETLCSYLHESRAINANIDNILISRGSQMSIYLAFSKILKNGGKVIVGELNYQTANETISSLGGELVKINVDQSPVFSVATP